MTKLGRYGSVALAFGLGGGRAAGANGPLAPLEPVPGNGPGGRPMTTSTDIAVGLPATASTKLVYPVDARVEGSDNYNGEKVDDPYRWLENLDSKATQDWVSAQNKVSQPRLAAIQQRTWVKERLAKLWNYERFNAPVKERG